jgi:hypothetical protein
VGKPFDIAARTRHTKFNFQFLFFTFTSVAHASGDPGSCQLISPGTRNLLIQSQLQQLDKVQGTKDSRTICSGVYVCSIQIKIANTSHTERTGNMRGPRLPLSFFPSPNAIQPHAFWRVSSGRSRRHRLVCPSLGACSVGSTALNLLKHSLQSYRRLPQSLLPLR